MSIEIDRADRFLSEYERLVLRHRLHLIVDRWGDIVITPWVGLPEEMCFETALIRGNSDLPAPSANTG